MTSTRHSSQRLDRTADVDSRDWLLEGLASTRVPELLDDNVALATSGRLNPREISKLLVGGRWKEVAPPAGLGDRPRRGCSPGSIAPGTPW